ncbi:Uncharacterized protein PPKH_2360 [Pseudomonas putida]|nr:Uncharacterized protein PPKH_2360 [Pseudomonas putida]
MLPPPQPPAKNRVTGKQIDRISGHEIFAFMTKPLILKEFQKLARHLLYLSYNNNKKCDTQ